MGPLALVAVLVYAPPSGNADGNAGLRRAEVQAALEAGLGASVDAHALRQARAERAAGWVRAEELGFFARAQKSADEGRRRLEQVELSEADAAFVEAEQIYEQNLAWPGVAGAWSQVALWRGVAAFERREIALARRLFQRAVALDPTARLTEASARPDVVRAFAEAVRPGAAVPLVVHCDEAELSVDGGPAKKEVAAGEHVVVARPLGQGRRPIAVLVDDASGLEITLAPPADLVLEALDSLQRGPNVGGLRALAAARGLDAIYVVAAGIDAGELMLVGERVDASGCASPAISAKAAATLIDRLQHADPRCPAAPEELLAAPAIAHPRPAPVVTPIVVEKRHPPTKKKVWERPWLWLGILVVTTATVGLAAGLAPSTTSYKASVDGSAFAH